MIDHDLSAAVVTYIWGDREVPWPSERPESLGERQLAHLPKIKSILVTAFANDPPIEESIAAMSIHVRSTVRHEHPELTEEATAAVGDYYSYSWK